MRSRIELNSPGTEYNFKIVVHTPTQSRYGIGNPKNIGFCSLFIVPLNDFNQPVDKGQRNVLLKTGESLSRYLPPSGTAKIAVVCTKDCGGPAAFEYDTPDS